MSEHLIPWWRIDLGDSEAESVRQAINARCINQGKLCREFEERVEARLNVGHAVTCANGSAALFLALLSCGVEPGDEVIVPAVTYIATAHAVKLAGARVRLVDVQEDRPLLDPVAVGRAITPLTRAIIAVHLNGCACDINGLRRYGLPVIEDAAQAFCSRGPDGWLGTLGDAGAYSMSIAKIMTTGEGGFMVSNNRNTAGAARCLRNQGVEVIADNVFDRFGFNFRLTDIQAAIGLAQFAQLPRKIEAVRNVYRFYREAVPGLHILPVDLDGGELPLWTQGVSSNRDFLISRLGEQGIQVRPFNPCLADSPQLEATGDFPNARRFAEQVFTLPSGPDQSGEDLEKVARALREVV
ncbi:MAG: DegT/DnrJ/EryC1/StrS family aminotransferase [Proteobacteria bacterium]|nr:DegT/DnrJ/EryC1/StrS family aminotransferase [Pseudomonadota bacterium]MBU1738362.1 DegT/DnrJ/EryC1/StrS family aminotransferase [Pseudomonadota bacterium]